MGFVLKSWIRSFAKSPWSGPYLRDAKIAAIKETILGLLESPDCHIVLACSPENSDLILGFVCYELTRSFPVLHYVYVKDMVRRMKVGSDLVQVARSDREGTVRYTFKTPICVKFLPGAMYKPGLASRTRQQR